ncbi:MAG: carbohydrate kinase [Desulfobacterales bacterium SG8_35]|nr:MAG: carbohydrate kinase [Desulfobacterales bacterium SG8_35]
MSRNDIHPVDVLCVGAGTYDLVYSVDRHPQPDEKIRATSFIGCGGGPAANGAITVARLGLQAAFVGYLGKDIFGKAHIEELQEAGVETALVTRGEHSSALSVVMVKPDGSRALVNYRKPESLLAAGSVDFSRVETRVILFDGHEPHISPALARSAREMGAITVLDAGSIHSGTEALAGLVDYLVCSERFGLDFTGESGEERALARLGSYAPNVIITLGERGLVWKNARGSGRLEAFKVRAVDTTGAGDVFHGALAACLAQKKEWLASLSYASAAGALCCTKIGARLGIPTKVEVEDFLAGTGDEL